MRKTSLAGIVIVIFGQVFVLVSTPTAKLLSLPVWELLTIGLGLLLPIILLIVGAVRETGDDENDAHHFSGMVEENIVSRNEISDENSGGNNIIHL